MKQVNNESSQEIKPQVVHFYEKHQKLHVRSTDGIFSKLRIIIAIITQIVFYGTLWLDWNDRQAVLFHLAERKFYIFGLVFWPQDIIYLTILLIISAYGLFLVTAVAGRVFCGYACPQTVYTELFMWIENKIEGDRNARVKLDKDPWNFRKIRIKFTKHFVWIVLSLWTGFTFVGYFTPIKELVELTKTFSFSGWELFWILFYAGFAYLMAGFMREQVCKYMCPYARFQSVMFDPDTMIITYDEKRGEPRGSRSKKVDPKEIGLGSCIDCGLCVQVCPTGIDIRKGLQYECIGCSACIDVCDDVMTKMNYPKGLIKYSTENAMQQGWTKKQMIKQIVRPRILIYSFILIFIVSLSAYFIATRSLLKVDVIKDSSSLAVLVEEGKLENRYLLKFINADEKTHQYKISVSGLDDLKIFGKDYIEVNSASIGELPIAVQVDPDKVPKGSHKIYFEIKSIDNKNISIKEKGSFIIPNNY